MIDGASEDPEQHLAQRAKGDSIGARPGSEELGECPIEIAAGRQNELPVRTGPTGEPTHSIRPDEANTVVETRFAHDLELEEHLGRTTKHDRGVVPDVFRLIDAVGYKGPNCRDSMEAQSVEG